MEDITIHVRLKKSEHKDLLDTIEKIRKVTGIKIKRSAAIRLAINDLKMSWSKKQ